MMHRSVTQPQSSVRASREQGFRLWPVGVIRDSSVLEPLHQLRAQHVVERNFLLRWQHESILQCERKGRSQTPTSRLTSRSRTANHL